MLKLKLFLFASLGPASVMGIPAAAQFEITPDHFAGSSQDDAVAATAPYAELKARIAAAQAELNAYKAQISRQAEAVENARELAAGAGGMEDSAYVFIDDYLRQYRELEQVRRELAPHIAQSEAALRLLNQQWAASEHTLPALSGKSRQKPQPVATKLPSRQRVALSASARPSH